MATRRGSTMVQGDEGSDNDYDDEGESSNNRRNSVQQLRPADQVQLTEDQKAMKHPCSIESEDPNIPQGVVKFDYAEAKFVKEKVVDHMRVHFDMPGLIVAMDHPLAIRQTEYLELVRSFEEKNKPKEVSSIDKLLGKEPPKEEKPYEPPLYPETHQLKNQFNFNQRATQTFNNPLRERQLATLPPPIKPKTCNVTHWDIFDSYLDQLKQQIKSREEREKSKTTFGDKKEEKQEGPKVEEDKGIFFSKEFMWSSKLMERMVNLNQEELKFLDYKYWESQGNSKGEGSADFRRLYEFNNTGANSTNSTAGKTVTALCWNPDFTDMLAVGYGTYDFSLANTSNQDAKDAKTGMICIFSLKGPETAAEYIFNTDSGVMSLDFHPQHPSLLCCGLYDGTVLVYDVRSKSKAPLFVSSDPKTKHTDPVWQVTWQKDEPEKNLNFFSVSSDGRVTNWIMNKTELINEEVVELKLAPQEDSEDDEEEPDDDTLVGLAGGSCFDFNQDETANMFIVGTEEGGLYSYSKAVGSAFLRSFTGHHMAVYTVRWNPFHPGIFLSCGADWTVKLWEVNHSEPVMTFDLGCAVADISWAPFSSTVFVVGTVDSKIRVFDLSIDKHAPVGMDRGPKASSQHITHVAFNPAVPIISVGLDTGSVYIVKLSGSLNLHKDLSDIDRTKELLRLDDLMIINDNQGTIAGRNIRAEQLRREAEEKAAREKAAAEAEKKEAD